MAHALRAIARASVSRCSSPVSAGESLSADCSLGLCEHCANQQHTRSANVAELNVVPFPLGEVSFHED